MRRFRLRTILLGQSLTRTGRVVVTLVAFTVAFYLFLTQTGALGNAVDRWLGTNYTLVLGMGTLTALGAFTAYANDGALLSIAVIAVPLLAYFFSGNVAFAGDPTILGRLSYATQGAILYGVPLGIVGYSVGRGVARSIDTSTAANERMDR